MGRRRRSDRADFVWSGRGRLLDSGAATVNRVLPGFNQGAFTMSLRRWMALAAIVLVPTVVAGVEDDGFVALVKGTDPAQFELVGIGPETLKIVDGEIQVSGKPNGYFATKEVYRNYVLR